MVFSKISDFFKQPNAKKFVAVAGAVMLLGSIAWAAWSYRKKSQRKASGTNLDPNKVSGQQAEADPAELERALKTKLASGDGTSILEVDVLVAIQKLHVASNRTAYFEHEINSRRHRRKILAEEPGSYVEFVQKELKEHPQEITENMSSVLASLGVDQKRYQTSVRLHILKDPTFLQQFNEPLEELYDFSTTSPSSRQLTAEEAKKIYKRALELLSEEDPECEPEFLAEIKNIYVIDRLFEEFGIEEEEMNNMEALAQHDHALGELIESYRAKIDSLAEPFSPNS